MEDTEAILNVHRFGFLNYLNHLLLRPTGSTGYPTLLVKRTSVGHETNAKRCRVEGPQQYTAQIIELVGHDDLDVCKDAIGLVKQLLRHRPLTDEESIKFYDHLADDRLEISHEMGGVIYDLFIAQNLSSQSGSKDVDSLVAIKRLLHIMREIPPDCSVIDIVIDAVWGHMEAMRDWKCIISLLDNVDEKDATYLIRLLGLSVRKAVGERITGSFEEHIITEDEDQDEDEEEESEEDIAAVKDTSSQEELLKKRRDITSAVMKVYPDLLLKFKADKENIIRLVQIILCMDLKLYSAEDLRKMLEVTIDAFFAHGDDMRKDKDHSILTSYVNVIRFLTRHSSGGEEWPSTVERMTEDLGVKLVEQMVKAMTDGDVYSMLVNMKRLYALRCRSMHIGIYYHKFLFVLAKFSDNLPSAIILQVSMEAVQFAFIDPPSHIAFLSCGVVDLAPGLCESDADIILRDLTGKCKSVSMSMSKFPEMWKPYHEFFLELLKDSE